MNVLGVQKLCKLYSVRTFTRYIRLVCNLYERVHGIGYLIMILCVNVYTYIRLGCNVYKRVKDVDDLFPVLCVNVFMVEEIC